MLENEVTTHWSQWVHINESVQYSAIWPAKWLRRRKRNTIEVKPLFTVWQRHVGCRLGGRMREIFEGEITFHRHSPLSTKGGNRFCCDERPRCHSHTTTLRLLIAWLFGNDRAATVFALIDLTDICSSPFYHTALFLCLYSCSFRTHLPLCTRT